MKKVLTYSISNASNSEVFQATTFSRRSINVLSGSHSTVIGRTMLRSPHFIDTTNHRAIMITPRS